MRWETDVKPAKLPSNLKDLVASSIEQLNAIFSQVSVLSSSQSKRKTPSLSLLILRGIAGARA
jgi:type III secretory pathway lipoprotein EscJ